VPPTTRSASTELAIVNARIYTGEEGAPWAEALLARRGRIHAVGSREEVDRLVGSEATRFDAGGRRILPGFVDAHVHLLFAYQLGSWIDLTDHPSLTEVQRRVRAYAQEHPEDPVVRGYGFDYQALTDRGLPTAQDLDRAVPDRPVMLDSWDGHTAWTNGPFLRLATAHFRSLGREVGDPERDPRSGELTGIFRTSFDLDLPELMSRRSVEGLRRILATAARYGITTAFDVQVPFEDLGAYERLEAQGELPIRIKIALYHPRGTPSLRYPVFRAASDRFVGERLRAGAVKLYIDGVQETHTACLLDPYTDDPSNRGTTVYPESEFRSVVADLDRAGFQILTHACGDGGVRAVLDAYERLSSGGKAAARRHRIEHCENIASEDLGRFARLGVIPCMMPHHSSPDLTRRWRQSMGEARWGSAFPWRELLDRGAALAFASDWPVADLNPFVHLRSAVARNGIDGLPSPHRLTVREAIDAYTRGAAYAAGCDADCGSLASGKWCDLVVLSDDPFDMPVERLDQVRVVATLVGGEVAYSDPTVIDTSGLPASSGSG
jgi:predicted amidohydrolase YtcJ